MEQTIYDITLELQKACAPWALTVKKGDTHRRLRLRLLSGGSPYPIADDCYAVFTAQKPDGTVIYNSCTREGSTLIYDLTPQTTAAAGVLNCEVKLYGPEDALLTSAAFILNVEDTVYTQGEEVITSTGEVSALTQLITQARETVADMEKVLENEANHAVIDDTRAGEGAWSSKNIVDKLCPAFTESGSVVSCDPVEGYPLEVISTIAPKESGDTWGEIKLYHSGKNLSPNVSRTVNKSGTTLEFTDNILTINGSGDSLGGYKAEYAFVLPAGVYTWSLKYVSGACSYSGSSGTVYLRKSTGAYVSVKDMYGAASRNGTFTLTEPTSLCLDVVFASSATFENLTFTFQVEAGDTATEFEPYKATTVYTADLTNANPSSGSYNWTTGVLTDEAGNLYQHDLETNTFEMIDEESIAPVRNIYAYPGENILISDCGDTAVGGRADPVAIIDKLTNAIIALGGNV